MKLGSPEYLEAMKEATNADAEYRRLAKNESESYLLVLEAEPARGVPQSLGGSRPLFPTLGMAVVLLVASTPEAVTYSRRLWGEPAFTGGVKAVADEGGGRRMVELRAHLEGPPGLRVRVAVPAPGRATTREDRRYRLFSRLGREALADYMHVRAPCRRSLAPRRGTLVWTAPGGSVVERRPLCLLVMEYGPGSVVFGGPRRL
ncbi:MAG: hypothetical protein H5U04_03630 [Firmicutes bacterium]|nr:hypothetical protein [Bacillota bacterium]